MMKYTLKNENIESYNESDTFSFPKYDPMSRKSTN